MVGEIGVLTGKIRSATVVSSEKSIALSLNTAGVRQTAQKIPLYKSQDVKKCYKRSLCKDQNKQFPIFYVTLWV